MNSFEADFVETISKNEMAEALGTNWKVIKKICEENNYVMLEPLHYEHHRGNLYVKEDFLQWIKDCNIVEELEKREAQKLEGAKKPAGLDNQGAFAFIRTRSKNR